MPDKVISSRLFATTIRHTVAAAQNMNPPVVPPPTAPLFVRTDYWANGDYGFPGHGHFHVDSQFDGGYGGFQTLPSSITLPPVPRAVSLSLYVDFEENSPFYNVWDLKQARILIDGVVWKDWFSGHSHNDAWPDLNAGSASSWPPPSGEVTIQIRVHYYPPVGTLNGLDWRWYDVNVTRYVITVTTPNP